MQREVDQAAALSLVLRAIETVPPDRRGSWVELLCEGNEREFATARMEDLAVLDADREDALEIDEADSPEEAWSTWLQQRLAESSDNVVVLRRLALYGRTRRVRGTAIAEPARVPGAGDTLTLDGLTMPSADGFYIALGEAVKREGGAEVDVVE